MKIRHILKNGREAKDIKGHRVNEEKSRIITHIMKEVSKIEKKSV